MLLVLNTQDKLLDDAVSASKRQRQKKDKSVIQAEIIYSISLKMKMGEEYTILLWRIAI